MADPAPVSLVGVHGGECFGAAAAEAVATATVVVGAARHLATVSLPDGARRLPLDRDLSAMLDRLDGLRRDGERVCVLVSGDPGFFGLGRLARARLGPGAVTVHPAPSSVALAFARAGIPWDDAVVVSAHGRAPDAAVEAVLRAPKVAVLCSPDSPPQSIGRAVLERGGGERQVTVACRLGEADEQVWTGDVAGLAAARFDPVSVVLFSAPGAGVGCRPALEWGRPDSGYAHRDGMITKAEVRAVALGKLALPAAGVLWDVGAGSGSVAAECARLAPGLAVYAVERAAAEMGRLRSNLAGTGARVVEGAAPAALAGLPDPDRAFVGGGGIEVLDAVRARLRPAGTVVATYASPERAAAAARRLGSMVQVSVNRAVPVGPDGSFRLAAENPVFICWGPRP